MTTYDSYEIKIGDTVFVVSHSYDMADLLDIAADYLSDKNSYDKVKSA